MKESRKYTLENKHNASFKETEILEVLCQNRIFNNETRKWLLIAARAPNEEKSSSRLSEGFYVEAAFQTNSY